MHNDRQHRSEMGRIIAQSSAGFVVKAAVAIGIFYAAYHGFLWMSTALAPIRQALAG